VRLNRRSMYNDDGFYLSQFFSQESIRLSFTNLGITIRGLSLEAIIRDRIQKYNEGLIDGT
jgi:hypothetical protein